jgi:tetratricopeptide (TPR) repeat protein
MCVPCSKTFVLRTFILLFYLGLANYSTAQELPEGFARLTDSIILNKSLGLHEINSAFNDFEQDTTLIRYLSNEAETKNALKVQCYALNQLGSAYRAQSEYNKARKLHDQALVVAKNAEDIEFITYTMNKLSVLYRRTDAIQTALDNAQEALRLAEEVDEPTNELKKNINLALNNIGNIYHKLEQYSLAIENFEDALSREKTIDNKVGMALNYQDIGTAYEAQGKLQEALNYYNQALKLFTEINAKHGILECNYRLAHTYVHMNLIEEARVLLEDSLVDSKQYGDQALTANIEINLGWTLIHTKDFTESEKHLKSGYRLAKNGQLLELQAEATKFLSDLNAQLGNHQLALEYFKESMGLDKRVSNNLNRRYVSDLTLRYDSEKKSQELEALAKQNEIINLRLKQNRTTLLVSSLALALLALILFVLYRQYNLKKEKQLLALEQSMLRSQMNPHFIFNSLNSIKLYIINNEKKNAVHYLNKFSKLVRKILEVSTIKEISLAEELETVELYMNIENTRFSNQINFHVNVSEKIDMYTIKIPSLILQPFLENALWHGLSSKKGEKIIDIEVTKPNPWFIHISITDNGVGRVVSEKIKQRKVLKRKSMGIDITKERLANFSKDFQYTFDVSITDLYDDENRAMGTRVLLKIPTL